MPSSDRTSTLGHYVTLKRGTTYKSRLLDEPGPVLLGLASIARNGGFRSDSLRTYGGDSPAELLVSPGELYVALKDVSQAGDLLGAVARLPSHERVGRLTQDTVRLIPRSADVPVSYLYWLMRTPEYRTYCRSRATGTTNLSLSRKDFLDFPAPTPTTSQRATVALLDLIEERQTLNARFQTTLESALVGEFRARFIDFTSPKSISPGSPLKPIGDVLTLCREQVDPSELQDPTPYIGLGHMPRGRVLLSEAGDASDTASPKSSFCEGDILFGRLRPYFKKVGLAMFDGVCSTDIAVFRPTRPWWRSFALLHLAATECIDYANAMSTGTRMPRVSWRDLMAYEVLLPAEQHAADFESFASPVLARLKQSTQLDRTLGELRDALLSRLASGNLELTELAEQVEDVA